MDATSASRTDPDPSRAPVYRAPQWSRREDIGPFEGAARGLRLDVCGIGGRLLHPPATWGEALGATDAEHGERAAARLRRFAMVPTGSEVWTRSDRENFYVGVLCGPWRYDASPAAHAVDLVHVRSCRWNRASPPAAVAAAFARGGRNFQQVRA